MSLTTEEIIGGMYRAHKAGQPFAALVANPQFANLPIEDKKKVLSGLRERMGGESTSTVNAITSMLKSMAGGALAGVPLGAAVPLALEFSEGGTKRSVLEALKMASQNKNVKLLVGTSMAIGAAGGLLSSALNLHRSRSDRKQFQSDLGEAAEGGEALAAASFGAIGGRSSPAHINVDPVQKVFRDMSIPMVVASGRLGHYNALAENNRTERMADLAAAAQDRMINRGHPVDPDRLATLVKNLSDGHANYGAMHNIVLNSYHDLNVKPEVANEVANDIAGYAQDNQTNIDNLSALEQVARRVRDMKRGDR